jgi:hypothetical protein
MGESFSSVLLELVGDGKGFAFDVIRECGEYGLDVVHGQVVEIDFLFESVDFVLDVNLLGFFKGRAGADLSLSNFNLARYFLFIVFVSPR